MPALITLLYPAVDFDEDYYLTKHMSLVQKTWENSGLLDWKVVKLDPASGNTCQCIMEWESVEAFQKAVSSEEGAAVTADMKNYTQGTPAAIVGSIVAKQ